MAKLLEGLPKTDERIAKAIATRAADFAKASPNSDRGVAVFQKNCAACHQIAGKGNRVGPQLDGAGNRGVERLLEDVLDPNRNVDVNFRATILALDDGQVVNGIIVREEGPVLVLVDSERRTSSGSPRARSSNARKPGSRRCPRNVIDLLSPQESERPAGLSTQATQARRSESIARLSSDGIRRAAARLPRRFTAWATR